MARSQSNTLAACRPSHAEAGSPKHTCRRTASTTHAVASQRAQQRHRPLYHVTSEVVLAVLAFSWRPDAGSRVLTRPVGLAGGTSTNPATAACGTMGAAAHQQTTQGYGHNKTRTSVALFPRCLWSALQPGAHHTGPLPPQLLQHCTPTPPPHPAQAHAAVPVALAHLGQYLRRRSPRQPGQRRQLPGQRGQLPPDLVNGPTATPGPLQATARHGRRAFPSTLP